MSEQVDTAETVIESIRRGQYDAQLSSISEACHERRKYASWLRGRELREGDRVQIIDGRPRYLIGELATIKKVMQSWVLMRLDKDIGKFSRFADVRTPMSIIKKYVTGDPVLPKPPESDLGEGPDPNVSDHE